MPSSEELVGQTLGRYRVERLLGSGGMGQVYLAVQPQIGSRVAVKVLNPECAKDQTLVERFFNEARSVNLIRHDGIVNVLDLSTLPDGRPYIVMEFLDGTSLAELIAERGPLPLDQLTSMALQALAALQAAHAKQIVHRDLKPENLMVTQGGRLKVLDFGIAKLVPEEAPVTVLTQTGMVLGTPAYMAPEQILGGTVDARTDIYSMGVILFEGATGQKPFAGRTLYELFDQQLKAAPPPPRTLRPGLPPGYEAVILRALAKRPEHRYQSAGEMAQALEQAPEADAAQTPQKQLEVRVAPASALTETLPPSPMTLSDTTLPPGPAPVGESAAAPTRRSRGLWLGLLAAGVLVTGSLTAAGIVALRDCGSSMATQGSLPPGDKKIARKVTTLSIKKPDYDPRSFRPLRYLERAREMAQRVAGDMQLTTFNIDGVYPDGHADLTLRSDFIALYGFRSPSLSRGDSSKPANLEQNLPCLVTVMASAHEVRVSRQVSPSGCTEEILPRWRCNLVQAFARARSRSHDADVPKGDNVVAGVVWYKDGWTLDFGSSRYARVSQDCSRVE